MAPDPALQAGLLGFALLFVALNVRHALFERPDLPTGPEVASSSSWGQERDDLAALIRQAQGEVPPSQDPAFSSAKPEGEAPSLPIAAPRADEVEEAPGETSPPTPISAVSAVAGTRATPTVQPSNLRSAAPDSGLAPRALAESRSTPSAPELASTKIPQAPKAPSLDPTPSVPSSLRGAPDGFSLAALPDSAAPAVRPPPPVGPAQLEGIQAKQGGRGLELGFRWDRPVLVRSFFDRASRTLELRLFPVQRGPLLESFPPLRGFEKVEDLGKGSRAELKIVLEKGIEPQLPLPQGEFPEFQVLFPPKGKAGALPEGAKLNRLASKQLRPGLVESRYRYQNAKQEGSDLYVLEVDPKSPEVELAIGTGAGRILGKETCSKMARRAGALAAINASFFSRRGDPLGFLAKQGRVLSMPLMQRGVLGVFDGGRRNWIGNPGFSGRVELPFGSLRIHGVNQTRKPGSVVLYTPEWGESTQNPGGGMEIAVVRGRIVDMADGNVSIPEDGYAIAVEGSEGLALLSKATLGEQVEVVSGMTPPWDRADFALGGGPVLVEDSRVSVRWQEENFSRSLVTTKAPRTGVGIDASGKLLFFVLDGRKPGVNRGVDLFEFAALFRHLGCVAALNLDGGGSSTYVRDGLVQNRPSDGSERPVSTAILVLPREESRVLAQGIGASGSKGS